MSEKPPKSTKARSKSTKARSDSSPLMASTLLREKHKAGMKMRGELEIEDPYEVEEMKAAGVGGPMSLKDKMAHESGVLKSEWALFGGEMGPEVWLTTNKGYSPAQSKRFIGLEGESQWFEERTKVQNAILEKMAKRNVDQIVENNEYFTRGAKLGLVKVMEGLSKNPIRTIDPSTGRWGTGYSMKDMNDAANALEKFHTVYLKAMGIHPKDGVGINQVINQLKVIQVNTTAGPPGSTPTTVTTSGEIVTEGAAPDSRLEQLTYDEMFQVIEKIREAGFTKDLGDEDNEH